MYKKERYNIDKIRVYDYNILHYVFSSIKMYIKDKIK